MRVAVAVVLFAGCAGASPLWPRGVPAPLPRARAAAAPAEVWMSYARYPWHGTGGSRRWFPVFVSAPGGNPPLGTPGVIGHVRSADQPIDADLLPALYCDWGPGKDDCDSGEQRGRPLVVASLDQLRQQAAAAGADAVRQVRCFADGDRGQGRLWCEGEAVVITGPVLAVPPSAELAIEADPEPAPSRWSLGASATAGVYGSSFVVGTTLHMRYRAGELAFHMVSPLDQSAAVLGLELLGRHSLGRGTDLVFGAAGLLLTPLAAGGEADEAGTELAAMPVLGLGWRPELTFFGGYGKVFIDARSGWLLSTGDGIANGHDLDRLSAELVIGLTTP